MEVEGDLAGLRRTGRGDDIDDVACSVECDVDAQSWAVSEAASMAMTLPVGPTRWAKSNVK